MTQVLQVSPSDQIFANAYSKMQAVINSTETQENDKVASLAPIIDQTLREASAALSLKDRTIALLRTENSANAQVIFQAVQARDLIKQEISALERMQKQLSEQILPFTQAQTQLKEKFAIFLQEHKLQVTKQETLDKGLKTVEQRTQGLTVQAADIRKKYGTLEKNFEQLTENDTKLDRKAEQFLRECRELSAALKEINKQIEKLGQKSEHLNTNSTALEASFSTLQTETQALKATTKETQKDYRALHATYSELDQETTSLKQRYEQIAEKYLALKQHYGELSVKTGELKTQFKLVSNNYDHLHTRYTTLGNETSTLLTITSRLTKDYDKLKVDFTAEKTRNDTRIVELEKQEAQHKLDSERKIFMKTTINSPNTLSKNMLKGTGSIGACTLLFVEAPIIAVLLITAVISSLTYFVCQYALKHYRKKKFNEYENEFRVQHKNNDPRKVFEYAKTKCQQLRSNPVYRFFWT